MTPPAPTFRSIPALFKHRVSESASDLAYEYPVGDSDTFTRMTWQEVGQRVRSIACAFLARGLVPEQRAAILSATRVDWILMDLGILCAGGAATTIYPSNTAEECAFILGDSGSRFVFAEDRGQVEKLRSVKASLPEVELVVTLDESAADGEWVITLESFEAEGRAYDEAHPEAFDQVSDAVESHHLATLIYTSGTTGKPKGVELLHDCWVFEAEAIEELQIFVPGDHFYHWLPLAHSFGKVLEVAQIKVGIAATVDGRIPKLLENLGRVRPTLMAAAPRIFEKLYNKIVTNAQEGGALQMRVFRWAVHVSLEVSRRRQAGDEPSGWLAMQHAIADRMVFKKIRELFGGRVRYFVSGSAPLSRQIAEFFHGAGILILEGYGLTESSAASCVNVPGAYRFGTVGRPIPGVEIRIAEEDGEILLGGRGIMRGYHALPDETAAALDDGWLRTGDIGEVDDQGFLKITDRKKDLIKTSGGKYVAPQALEGRLKTLCPYIAHVLVHGDRRNYCTALVTLDTESVQKWARDRGLAATDLASISKDAQIVAMIEKAVESLNGELASYETIKKHAILPNELTLESGELTPSMKMKRKVVEKRYQEILDGFYEGAISAL